VSQGLLIGTVAAVELAFILGAGYSRRAYEGGRLRAGLAAAGVSLFWLVPPAWMARSGALRFDTVPPNILLVVGVLTVATVILAFSAIGNRFRRLPLYALIGYQAFRIPVEWMLFRLHEEGVVPVQMTFAGYNYDVVTGVAAVALAFWAARRRIPGGIVLFWNVLGLALLLNIVTIALLSAPVPFRTFTNEPANLLPLTFPYVWLPCFLVQAALFGHIIVFRRLRHGDRLREPW
jgi:hypothetical protein